MLAVLPHMGLSKGCSGHGSWFPPEGIIQQRETKLIAAVPFDDLLSEVAYCLFCFILLHRNKIQPTLKEKGIRLYVLKGGVSKQL